MFKEELNKKHEKMVAEHDAYENKRRTDHDAFDQFVKLAHRENSELAEYGVLSLEHFKLQDKMSDLKNKYADAMITANSKKTKSVRSDSLSSMSTNSWF